ncbi:hypothetical protein [Vibrio phage VP882]|uniref:Uncharacterized protein n=1 Tax=Vibrio phage VP882 TaxID=2913982 RepID=A2I2Z0_9CAUD|nr:hypothetical protein VPVV882_gp40 [Vibrio phage VP882]ABM73404.1 hypothetical protein [Vibrio phage VP882]
MSCVLLVLSIGRASPAPFLFRFVVVTVVQLLDLTSDIACRLELRHYQHVHQAADAAVFSRGRLVQVVKRICQGFGRFHRFL